MRNMSRPEPSTRSLFLVAPAQPDPPVRIASHARDIPPVMFPFGSDATRRTVWSREWITTLLARRPAVRSANDVKPVFLNPRMQETGIDPHGLCQIKNVRLFAPQHELPNDRVQDLFQFRTRPAIPGAIEFRSVMAHAAEPDHRFLPYHASAVTGLHRLERINRTPEYTVAGPTRFIQLPQQRPDTLSLPYRSVAAQ